jgi:hypothetical protein
MNSTSTVAQFPTEEMMIHRNFRGKHFMVQISRWQFQSDSERFNWNLYCYIYPDHPRFDLFEIEDYDSEAVRFFDWHGGATLMEFCYGHAKWSDKFTLESVPNRVAVKIGCDYLHHGDDAFSVCSEPSPVLLTHARELFAALSENA